MINKKKIVKFGSSDSSISSVSPIKNIVPEWYKTAESFNIKNVSIGDSSPVVPSNFKNCVPFLDSMLTGYSVNIWHDLLFDSTDPNNISIQWKFGPESVESRDRGLNESLPTPTGYSGAHFAWINPYSFQVPSGYSLLVTHPLNRLDLPFFTLSAIIDADKIMTSGRIPFFLKDNAKGVIKTGTPIFQIIPIKRDSWTLEYDKNLHEESEILRKEGSRRFYNYYRNNTWSKKDYS